MFTPRNCLPRGNVIFCTMMHLSVSSSQIILTKKKKEKEQEEDKMWDWLGSACRGTTKNPFDWNLGLPLSTPVCGPRKPNIHNNVNIENISLKTMWNGLTDAARRGSRTAPHALPASVQGGRRPPAHGRGEGGRQLQNKRHQPRLPLLSLFHMKVCKKQIRNKL